MDGRMHHVDSTDGVVLALHDLGVDGPPLLLCHATGFHGRVWAPLGRRARRSALLGRRLPRFRRLRRPRRRGVRLGRASPTTCSPSWTTSASQRSTRSVTPRVVQHCCWPSRPGRGRSPSCSSTSRSCSPQHWWLAGRGLARCDHPEAPRELRLLRGGHRELLLQTAARFAAPRGPRRLCPQRLHPDDDGRVRLKADREHEARTYDMGSEHRRLGPPRRRPLPSHGRIRRRRWRPAQAAPRSHSASRTPSSSQ